MADTESNGRNTRRESNAAQGNFVSPTQNGECEQPRQSDRGCIGEPMADPDRIAAEWPTEPRFQRDPWSVEPAVGRVANGVPCRVDRLKALGNAIVPQIAQIIGEAIIEFENAA
jgi:DNA (cytosine-5)-methyltransferase 1